MSILSVNNDYIFSFAEDINTGKLVNVDDVKRGSECGCICPCCKEPLIARHGDIREHGFAHHSRERKATLEICYMVTLYKYAEQIIKETKQITLPSYYGIFREKKIKFIDVHIDSQYEREDKQPDVIAKTKEGETYLIEFVFQYKVRHLKQVDYNNMNCISIDLSSQTLETIKDYISNPSNWEWLNSNSYFNKIEEIYRKEGKNITLVDSDICNHCNYKKDGCCVCEKKGDTSWLHSDPLDIYNNGKIYRICKKEYLSNINENKHMNCSHYTLPEPQNRSCFQCESNLSWANKDGMANCGMHERLRLGYSNNPERARSCNMFKLKSKP